MPGPNNPENPIFTGVDKHLSSPWFGLSIHSSQDLTYQADVRPINQEYLQRIADKSGSLGGLKTNRDAIRGANLSLWRSSDVITVVLDATTGTYKQGYLGDMIEATRIVNAIRAQDKKVRIVASHTDIFEGSQDPNIKLVPIPTDIPPATERPWQPRLLRFLGQVTEGDPVVFPLNAFMPILANIDKAGVITNTDMFSELNRVLGQGGHQFGIEPERWWKRGVHQLQALQIVSDLIGIEDVYQWKKFPDAYLYPNSSAKKTARRIVNLYKCFYSPTDHEGVSLLIHPGVATNGRKVELKFYPESRWKKVIDRIPAENLPFRNLTVMKPSEPAQAAIASRLAKHAREVGIKTTEILEAELKKKYGWTLGSFIAFLQELSSRRGLILGCDSMPAGHAAPAVGLHSVVLGSPSYNPGFYGPHENALIVMPNSSKGLAGTKDINPEHVARALDYMGTELLSR